jgi:small conductance mechanosensitive channel
MIQISKGKDLILSILNENPKYFKHPTRSFVKNLTDSELAVRPWAKSEDYGAVFTETLENCKTAFDAAGIVIQPYLKEMSAIKTNYYFFEVVTIKSFR